MLADFKAAGQGQCPTTLRPGFMISGQSNITTTHIMSSPFAFLPSPPDPAARQPFTTTSLLLPYLVHYVLAVLAILPNTFFLKVAVFPILLWQAWDCAVGRDVSVPMANSLGYENPARLRHMNFAFVVRFSNTVSFFSFC